MFALCVKWVARFFMHVKDAVQKPQVQLSAKLCPVMDKATVQFVWLCRLTLSCFDSVEIPNANSGVVVRPTPKSAS